MYLLTPQHRFLNSMCDIECFGAALTAPKLVHRWPTSHFGAIVFRRHPFWCQNVIAAFVVTMDHTLAIRHRWAGFSAGDNTTVHFRIRRTLTLTFWRHRFWHRNTTSHLTCYRSVVVRRCWPTRMQKRPCTCQRYFVLR